jgi:hypothetical protein
MHSEQITFYKQAQAQSLQEKQVLIQTISYLEGINKQKDDKIFE